MSTLCQSKVIEVNNQGNDSASCCIKGTCLCASLFTALYHIESNSVISITSSSVVLHNLTHMGKGYLNNVTITGKQVTVACNNSGILSCSHCSDIFIKGITWDQCGNPNHPFIINAFGFKYATNISISECIFKRSRVCVCVVIVLSSGFIQVQDSEFLFNYVTDSTNCPVFSSLYIVSGNEAMYMQNVSVNITGMRFYYNGALDYGKRANDSSSSTLFCYFTSQQSVKYHIENSSIYNSFGLGGNVICDDNLNVTMQFTNVNFLNNSNGGSVVAISSKYSRSFLLIDSCSYTHNINGSLKMEISTGRSNVTLHRLIIARNKGTFTHKDSYVYSNNNGQGSGILILSYCLYSSNISISLCNIQGNSGGKSIVYIQDEAYSQIASLVSTRFTDNVGSALFISGCTVKFENHVSFIKNIAENGAAVYLDQGSHISIIQLFLLETLPHIKVELFMLSCRITVLSMELCLLVYQTLQQYHLPIIQLDLLGTLSISTYLYPVA